MFGFFLSDARASEIKVDAWASEIESTVFNGEV